MINDIKGKKKTDIKDFIGNPKIWTPVNLRRRYIDMMCSLRHVHNPPPLLMVRGIVSWETRNVKIPFWKSESCALIRIMTIIKSKHKCTCAR